jgi:hypothetical protein
VAHLENLKEEKRGGKLEVEARRGREQRRDTLQQVEMYTTTLRNTALAVY